MKIKKATIEDSENIRALHLQAFAAEEAQRVADLAVDLLRDSHPVETISLVFMEGDEVVGHIAFSPVFLEISNEHIGYILAPLAVAPAFQHNNVGSTLVRHGLEAIANMGSFVVFVYGDPDYYSRFGFTKALARKFSPPHAMQMTEGWQAMKLNSAALPEGGKIVCVDALDDPDLW